MANLHVSLVSLSAVGTPNYGGIPSGTGALGTYQALSGTAPGTTSTLTGRAGQCWRLTPFGGDVYVAFGSTVTGAAAVAASGFRLTAGQTYLFTVSSTGDKVAVQDA